MSLDDMLMDNYQNSLKALIDRTADIGDERFKREYQNSPP